MTRLSLSTIVLLSSVVVRADVPAEVRPFLAAYCADCHLGGADEGGLDLEAVGEDLGDEATFARWERIFDRVNDGEMPPRDADQPSVAARRGFVEALRPELTAAHARTRGTVLRRLNRREYQNTLNDLFGTNLDLEGMLPEDGRSHEFDNVGDALGVSLVHMQRYMEAAGRVWDTAIANTTEPVEPAKWSASYVGTSEGDRFIGRTWMKLSDGAVVRFNGGGYPTGMMRGTGVRRPGRYRITVTGYAFQSKEPITFAVKGTSFARGSETPVYGYYAFPPGKLQPENRLTRAHGREGCGKLPRMSGRCSPCSICSSTSVVPRRDERVDSSQTNPDGGGTVPPTRPSRPGAPLDGARQGHLGRHLADVARTQLNGPRPNTRPARVSHVGGVLHARSTAA